jgi:hypothetical protein
MIRGMGGMPSGLPELCLDPIDGSTFPCCEGSGEACGGKGWGCADGRSASRFSWARSMPTSAFLVGVMCVRR